MLVWIPYFDLAKLLFRILNFDLEQITVPSAAAFDSTIHLLWDNVAVGNPAKSSLICFFLKQCDMFGAGVEVFGKPVCPVTTYFWHTSLRTEMLHVYFQRLPGEIRDEVSVCLGGLGCPYKHGFASQQDFRSQAGLPT